MKISVLGSGRWASNLAGLALKNGHQVCVHEKILENIPESEFYRTGKNEYIDLSSYYESGILICTHDLKSALDYSDHVIISILSQKLDEFMQDVKKIDGYKTKKYCLGMKGIESSTGRLLTEVMVENGVIPNNITALAGPGHVQSISAGKITHMVIAGYDDETIMEFKNALNNKNFTLFVNKDINGVEICAAVKNVYGILAGICVGSNNPTLRGSLICASIKEMERCLSAVGCASDTATGLALLGDYDATFYDLNSHNLTYGMEVMKQNSIKPNLPFNSVEGKDSVFGLINRMIKVNKDKENTYPLLFTCADIIKGEISLDRAVESIVEAIKSYY